MDREIVIIGGGIAGLTTSLALHRLGINSLVLESSNSLEVSGFALLLWTNAWRALDVLGIGGALRQNYPQIQRFQVGSVVSGMPLGDRKKDWDVRCVQRKALLESLERELPNDTIRYSSKVVSIEDSGYQKLVHLADGTIIKAKVVIGCDGVNSSVAKGLGLNRPVYSGKSAIRGFVEYPEGHGFEQKLYVFFGEGVRYGYTPCNDKGVYLFCIFDSSLEHDEDMGENPIKMKRFILDRIRDIPKFASDDFERAKWEKLSCFTLKVREPWSLLYQNISKNNICVAGDALHPMTTDLGQGGCSSIEDGIVLARCLGEVFGENSRYGIKDEKEEFERIKKGLEKYAKERKWRSLSIMSVSFIVGFLEECDWQLMDFVRKKFLSKRFFDIAWWMADYHCGELIDSKKNL